MSTENNSILKEAVINLTLDNAKLRKDLEEKQRSSDMWWNSYQGEQKRAEELNKELQAFKERGIRLPVNMTSPAEVVLNGNVNEEETE